MRSDRAHGMTGLISQKVRTECDDTARLARIIMRLTSLRKCCGKSDRCDSASGNRLDSEPGKQLFLLDDDEDEPPNTNDQKAQARQLHRAASFYLSKDSNGPCGCHLHKYAMGDMISAATELPEIRTIVTEKEDARHGGNRSALLGLISSVSSGIRRSTGPAPSANHPAPHSLGPGAE